MLDGKTGGIAGWENRGNRIFCAFPPNSFLSASKFAKRTPDGQRFCDQTNLPCVQNTVFLTNDITKEAHWSK